MSDARPTDRQLAIDHAPVDVRAAFAALLALDERFGQIVRATREPMVGQMRLTWWYEALVRLDTAPAPAEPLLRELQGHVLQHGIAGAELAELVEGWEALLDPVDAEVIDRHANLRGGRLFALAGRLMPGDATALHEAGRGWAAADLATHLTLPDGVVHADVRATEALNQAFSKSWPRSSRAIGTLALLQHLRLRGLSPIRGYAALTRFWLVGR